MQATEARRRLRHVDFPSLRRHSAFSLDKAAAASGDVKKHRFTPPTREDYWASWVSSRRSGARGSGLPSAIDWPGPHGSSEHEAANRQVVSRKTAPWRLDSASFPLRRRERSSVRRLPPSGVGTRSSPGGRSGRADSDATTRQSIARVLPELVPQVRRAGRALRFGGHRCLFGGCSHVGIQYTAECDGSPRVTVTALGVNGAYCNELFIPRGVEVWLGSPLLSAAASPRRVASGNASLTGFRCPSSTAMF